MAIDRRRFAQGAVAVAGAAIVARGATAAIPAFADRAALKAAPPALRRGAVRLGEAGREGLFRWDAAVAPARHAIDTLEGIYIAPDARAAGAWVRQADGAWRAEYWGARGDCADVSAIPPADQSRIKAEIAAATNDVAAFQIAFRVLAARGGGTLEFGPGIFRIGYDATWPAIVVGPDTVMRAVGGARIELDPSGIVDARTLPVATAADPRAYGCITTGNPFDMTRPGPSSDSYGGGAIFDHGSITADRMIGRVRFERLDIRCHTRIDWRGYDTHKEIFRLTGVTAYFAYDSAIVDCRVMGTPNTGLGFFGGFRRTFLRCRADYCGYGAQLKTANNGCDMLGVAIVGDAQASSRDDSVRSIATRYNKDAGFSFCLSDGLTIDDITSIGDHDRAVEGVFDTRLNAATLGSPLPGRFTLTNVRQDGRHDVGTIVAAAARGTREVRMADAYWVQTNDDTGTDRFLYIPGQDEGGTARAYPIARVDYGRDIVTLREPLAHDVAAGTRPYMQSRAGVNTDAGNEARGTIAGLDLRNIGAVFHAVSFLMNDGGQCTIGDVTMANVDLLRGDIGALTVRAARASVNRITMRDIRSEATGAALIVWNGGDRAIVEDVSVTGEVGAVVRMGSGEAAGLLRVARITSEACLQSPVMLYNTARARRIEIVDMACRGAARSGEAYAGFVQIFGPDFACDELVVTGNRVTCDRPVSWPIALRDPARPPAPGAIGRLVATDNDWRTGRFTGTAAGTGRTGPAPARSIDERGRYVTRLTDTGNLR